MTLNQASWLYIQIEVMAQVDIRSIGGLFKRLEIEHLLEDSIYDSIVDDVIVPVQSQVERVIG